MVIFATLLLALKAQSVSIGFSMGDFVTETHIESLIKVHRLKIVLVESGITRGITVIPVVGQHANIDVLLEAEAPKSEFNIQTSGSRSYTGDFPPSRWIALSESQIKGTDTAPFSVGSLLAAKKIASNEVSDLSYIPRVYLGPSLTYHIGFEIRLRKFGAGTERYQILDGSALPLGWSNLKMGRCRQVLAGVNFSPTPL